MRHVSLFILLAVVSTSALGWAEGQKTVQELDDCSATVAVGFNLLEQMVKTGNPNGTVATNGDWQSSNKYELIVPAVDQSGIEYQISIIVNGSNRCQILSIRPVTEERD